MAQFSTLGEIRTKLKNDLDLIDEDFITQDTLNGYINEAVDYAENLIHTIYEDYFLAKSTITLVTSQQAYALPSDIYGCKIRKVLYSNGADRYEIKRLPNLRLTIEDQIDEDYRYVLSNNLSTGYRIELYPPSRVSGTFIDIWYIRQARTLSADSDVCDIPEFVSFVIQYAKMRCYEFEGHPNVAKAITDKQDLEKAMVDSLTNKVIDEDTRIRMDFEFYQDFDYDPYFFGW